MLYRPPKGGGTFAKQQGYKVKKLIFTIMFSSCSPNISHGQQHSLQLSQALLIHQERYFKLVGNLLFCLRINPQGKVTTNQFINGCQFTNSQKSNGKSACTMHMIYVCSGRWKWSCGCPSHGKFHSQSRSYAGLYSEDRKSDVMLVYSDVILVFSFSQKCSCTGTPELHSHIQSWGGE